MSHVKVQPFAPYSHCKFKRRVHIVLIVKLMAIPWKYATKFTVILLVISINPSLALSPITFSMVHHHLQFIMFQLKSMMFSLHWSRAYFKHLALININNLWPCSNLTWPLVLHPHPLRKVAWCFFVIQLRYCLSVPMYCVLLYLDYGLWCLSSHLL